ncbi:MAG: hypothetical protein AcusKO_47440 [Acuticoccus sp.]
MHPIGGSAHLLDAGRQRVYSLDARSAWLWCSIEENRDDAEIIALFAEDFGVPLDVARNEVAGILDRLSTLLARDIDETDSVDPPVALYSGPVPARTARMRVALLGTVFDVGFPSRTLKDRFGAVMGHLVSDAAADIDVAVVEHGDGYAIVIDGKVAETCSHPSQVASQAKAAVCHAAINRTGFDGCLHAATVRIGCTTVLVPAESGSGKSCLSLALAGAGCELMSDDLTLLSLDGPTVRGVPTASCVKSEAWALVSADHPGLRSAPTHRRADGKRVRYLPVARPDAPPSAVGLIVFPRFRRGAAAGVTPLGPEDVLRRILTNMLAWRARLTPELLDAMIAWVETTRSCELTYGTSGDAVAALTDLAAGNREIAA